ncbi:hypothetical protein K438DRAFT_1803264 [Mycena galopus ATCC 62051]|nr:hypothetical protein K438DRAFT_1803264 [Mycena galopus ATCC 62051]
MDAPPGLVPVHHPERIPDVPRLQKKPAPLHSIHGVAPHLCPMPMPGPDASRLPPSPATHRTRERMAKEPKHGEEKTMRVARPRLITSRHRWI